MGEFTYENQGANTILVYSLDMDESMDTLAVGMVANNRIEGIISPGFVQKNTVRQLKYNISSKITLQQYFSRPVKKKQLIRVLKSLTEALLQAQKYLLGEESFLLDWNRIYVNVGNSNAYLLCFPIIRERESENNFYEFIRRLIYEIKFDESEDCMYVAALMNYINKQDNFSFRGFLERLEQIELTAGKGETGEITSNTEMIRGADQMMQAAAAKSPIRAAVSVETVQKRETVSPVATSASVNLETIQSDEIQEKPKKRLFSFGKKEKVKKNQEPKPDKKSTKKAAKNPSSPVGFAIPGKVSRPSQEEDAQKIQPQSTVPKEAVFTKHSPQIQSNFISAGEAVSPQKTVPVMQNTPDIEPWGDAYDSDAGTTVLISEEENATTLIGMGVSSAKRHSIFITRQKTGQKMEIQKEVFCIGKSRSFVDFYIDDNSTVSRSHADILVTEQGVYIRDNNSLNHTYVNEQMVPAGTQVLLSNGDTICLSDERFTISIK